MVNSVLIFNLQPHPPSMDPKVWIHGIEIWLLRYGLKQNLKVADGNGNANADAKVSTIALPVLCTAELKMTIYDKN